MNQKMKSIASLVGMLIITYLVFYFLQPARFGSLNSMLILMQQSLLSAVAACGFYFILSKGLFDFSLGSNIILSALIGCILSLQFGYIGLILGCIIVGTAIGLINGSLYILFKIPSIITTIGLLILYECIAVILAGGRTHVLPEGLRLLGRAPYNVIIALLAFSLAAFLLKYTRVGIYAKAIGKNEPMAQSIGINISKYKIIAFTLCGLFAGITALLTISYSSSILPVQGLASMARNFQPIMGCFVGLAFKKHINPVISIYIGVLVVAMIMNGIMTLGADSTIQNVIIGLTLLVIVSIMSQKQAGAVVK